jgi:predicted nucleic acid-binding protein
MTVAEALETLRGVMASPAHIFLTDDEPFPNVSLRSMSGHRQWTDAYLMRLARKNGLRFATLERKLNNMDDARAPVLLVVV